MKPHAESLAEPLVEPKERNFLRSAGIISLLTLLSRILGLLREGVCAYYFGAGELWGDFAIAFRIPNLSRRLFGEGALSAAFIPTLTRRMQDEDRQAAARLAGSALLLLATVLLALLLVGEAAIWMARRYSSDLSLPLAAIMLPYMFFICLVALMGGALNVVGCFGAPAMLPILFNVLFITGTVAGGLWAGGNHATHLTILAVTVAFAGIPQVALQWRALVRADFRLTLAWNPSHPDIRQIVAAMSPMIIGLAAIQLNSIADLVVAKIFVDRGGGAAVLSYAERLYQLPIGLFGAAIATAIFPRLARLATHTDKTPFLNTLEQGIRLAIFVGLPASVGLFAVRFIVVRALYQHGQFDIDDALRVSSVVGCYGAGVWAYILLQVLVRAYYSLKDTKTPMRVAGGAVLLNLALNLILVQRFEESGIAIATAVSAVVQVTILAGAFRRTGLTVRWMVVFRGAGKVIMASAIMYAAILILDALAGPALADIAWGVPHLCLLVGGGGLAFFVLAKLLKCDELTYLRTGQTGPSDSIE